MAPRKRTTSAAGASSKRTKPTRATPKASPPSSKRRRPVARERSYKLNDLDLQRGIFELLRVAAMWQRGVLERQNEDAEEHHLKFLEAFLELASHHWQSTPVARRGKSVIRLEDVMLPGLLDAVTSVLARFQTKMRETPDDHRKLRAEAIESIRINFRERSIEFAKQDVEEEWTRLVEHALKSRQLFAKTAGWEWITALGGNAQAAKALVERLAGRSATHIIATKKSLAGLPARPSAMPTAMTDKRTFDQALSEDETRTHAATVRYGLGVLGFSDAAIRGIARARIYPAVSGDNSHLRRGYEHALFESVLDPAPAGGDEIEAEWLDEEHADPAAESAASSEVDTPDASSRPK